MLRISTALVLSLATSAFALAPAHSLTMGDNLPSPVLGFPTAAPTFSWKLPDGAQQQSAYRLETTLNNTTTTSDWITSDQTTFVPHPGKPLNSRDRLSWRVNFKDETGAEAGWSQPASLEVGLLSAQDWKAHWINPAAENPDPKKEPVAFLQRPFTLDKPVASARLYATARGLFDLSLNSQPVANDLFANGFTPYNKRLDTLTYDVTPLLKQGPNTLHASLARGWFAGRFPFATQKKGPYGSRPQLLAQLEITFTDGTSQTLSTDNAWQATYTGPLRSSSLYDGEEFDARLTLADWGPVSADPDLGTASLAPKPFQPVRPTQTLTPISVKQLKPGTFIFDLGQNMVGVARLNHVPARKDRPLTLRFAEMLKPDGTPYVEAYRSARNTDTYTPAADGNITFQPRFTFRGFRFIELSGLPEDLKATPVMVEGIVLHTDFPTTGAFTSSHPKLNRLQSNITWGWIGNALDIPTDCPQRDERMGWTGDAQVFAPAALFNSDSLAFWKSWLASMRLDQRPDGSIPSVIPAAATNFPERSPGWMDAATFIPWDLFVRSGDSRLLSDNFDMMQNLVAFYRSKSKDHLIPALRGYGDWLQPSQVTPPVPGDGMSNRKGDTPESLLATAYYARSTQITADAARLLNRPELAKQFADEAAAIRAAFTAHYFDPAGKLQNAPETQTAYLLPLAFNLLPDNLRKPAADHLVRLVHDADDHLRTGFLGTPYIIPVLDQTGHSDLALKILLTETYPGWLYSINQGATTMWERWNSFSLDKGFGPVDMNSFNHYAYGVIGLFLYERLAGLTPDPAHPGYKHFFIRPLTTGPLTSASASYETPHGKAASSWTKNGTTVTLTATIPPNTTATLYFPDGRPDQTLPPGTHTFTCDLTTAPQWNIGR